MCRRDGVWTKKQMYTMNNGLRGRRAIPQKPKKKFLRAPRALFSAGPNPNSASPRLPDRDRGLHACLEGGV